MTPNLRIITMRDVVPEPVEWLWEPYIALGKITVIQGDGGEGKTTLATAIAAAVSRGDALPGRHNAISGDVIFQNAEDGIADTIVPRLERFGADVDRVHFIDEDEYALTLSDERIEKTIVEKNANRSKSRQKSHKSNNINRQAAHSEPPVTICARTSPFGLFHFHKQEGLF